MTRTGSHEDAEHFRRLIASFSTAMLVTHDERCALHARPMHVAGVDTDGSMWFATRVDSPKTEELHADRRVAVVMQGNASFVSVSGTAEFVAAPREKLEELWSESLRPWFPNGPDDRDLALLHVKVEEAAFWDYRGLRGVRYAFDALKHAVKGERVDAGEKHVTRGELR